MRLYKIAFFICCFILVVCGLYISSAVHAAQVTALIPGPPPSSAPAIDQPVSGATFTGPDIEVDGDCMSGLVVKLFSNATFIGSAFCGADGIYDLFADLEQGTNQLIAKQYDSLNQPSPPSAPVTVYFVPRSMPADQSRTLPADRQTAVSGPKSQTFALQIDYEYVLATLFPGQMFQLPIHFTGGMPPYAVSLEWGDGQTNIASRQTNDAFMSDHIYDNAGKYIVKIRVSDSLGNQAYMQFALIVNGNQHLGTSIETPFGKVETTATFPVLAIVTATCSLFLVTTGILIGLHWKALVFHLFRRLPLQYLRRRSGHM